MLKIFRYLSKSGWALLCVSVVFIVLSVWLDLSLPGYMADITTLVQIEGSELSEVWYEGFRMLGVALAGMGTMIVIGFLGSRVATNLAKDLRERLFNKVLDFSEAEINNFSVASLITRTTNDITQVQDVFVMAFQIMLRSPILAGWAIFKILDRGVEWSIATMVAIGVMMVLILVLVIFALPKFKKVQGLTDNLNRVTREHLTGIRVVKAYNAKDYEKEKFEDANDELMRTNLFVQRMMAMLWPVIGFIMQTLPLAIYLIGAYLIDAAGWDVRIDLFSNMIVFSSYAMMVIMAFLMMSMMFVMLPRAIVSAKRINEVLDMPLSLEYPEDSGATDSVNVNDKSGAIVFNNVSFKYPMAEDYVLEDINFSVNPGETVAFIGSTGSGKSTIVNLIARNYDVTVGDVTIDGRDVRSFGKKELARKIGYAMQKAVLFSGTVLSNVAFGVNESDVDIDDVKDAVDAAQGKDFVEKMDGDYHGAITQGGTNVSGGQKQRLGIARSIFKNPDIFIFDDSFSALDYKTDRKLRSTLRSKFKTVTTLIVAQRVATIKNADKIIVMDEGKIVGMGSHDELLSNCNTYYEIASSQLSKEELSNG